MSPGTALETSTIKGGVMLCHLPCHQRTEQLMVAQAVPLAVPRCATTLKQGHLSRKLKLCHWHTRWHSKGGFSPFLCCCATFFFIGVEQWNRRIFRGHIKRSFRGGGHLSTRGTGDLCVHKSVLPEGLDGFRQRNFVISHASADGSSSLCAPHPSAQDDEPTSPGGSRKQET
jgi:hypothetical protein